MRNMLVAVGLLVVGAVAAVADEATEADLAKMQGDWMVAKMKVSGEELPADDAQSLFRTVEGNNYTVSRYTKVIGKGTFELDATQSPKTIDSTPAAPGDPQKPIRGIYEFVGDHLRICIAGPGQPRPKNFEAKMYTGHTCIEWEREVK